MSTILSSVKNKINRTALFNLLTFIADATKSQEGFGFVPLDDAKKLQKAEPTFIVIDETIKNDAGMVKATATPEALAALVGTDEPAGDPAPEPPASKPEPTKYDFVKLDVIPTINRGNKKSDSYPFASLQTFPAEPHAFFVPKSDARPNPAKSLASTVASANKRQYEGPATKRTFTVRKHVQNGVEGALVIRTA